MLYIGVRPLYHRYLESRAHISNEKWKRKKTNFKCRDTWSYSKHSGLPTNVAWLTTTILCVLVWVVVFSIESNVLSAHNWLSCVVETASVRYKDIQMPIERTKKQSHFTQIWKRCSTLACKWINNIVSHTEERREKKRNRIIHMSMRLQPPCHRLYI